MHNTHANRLDRMKGRTGHSARRAAPPLWRLLWRIGIHLPPPLFMGFVPGALFISGSYSVVMVTVVGHIQRATASTPQDRTQHLAAIGALQRTP